MDDIPDFEELEWLESHTFDDDQFLDDSELEIQPPSPPSSPEPENPSKRPILYLPPKFTSQSAQKRLRSDLLHADDAFDLDKDGFTGKRARNEAGPGPNSGSELDPAVVIDDDLLDANVGYVENNGGHENDVDWTRHSPPQSTVEEMETVQEGIYERILSRFASEIDGDCVPVTGLDGERVYAKLCSIEKGDEERRKKLNAREFQGLLQEPVRVLMQKVEQDEFARALQASVDGPTQAIHPKTQVSTDHLWVDKYSPSSFTELLSDEQTNREVLLWLKQWDSCVFGSEIKSTADNVLFALRRHSSGSQNSKHFKKGYVGYNSETKFNRGLRAHDESDKENDTSKGIQEALDKKHKSSSPPEQKILLLCGPPGLGKTTLAHVAAKHCGYRVIEVNASDDRSSSTIETKILDVVQMNSVTVDSRPKCLVIDEIDGALGEGKGAVDVILKLVSSAERKSDSGKENVQGANSGRKSSREKPSNSQLLRPVICICNDLYAPALRPLRQVAKVHIFVKPTVNRIVNRLKYICNKEGVRTSPVALAALADYTECDIRSCLNTLQFLHKKKEALNMMEISSQVVGRKDVSKSAFDIWKAIFQKKMVKQSKKFDQSGSSMSKDFEFMYSLISNRGDYDLILDGIHENILQLHFVDPAMRKTVQCLDNLLISDINQRHIMRTQQMSLLVYQPPIAMLIHSLVAQVEKKDIEWPKSLQRHRAVLGERMDMFHMWHNRILPNISRHLSTRSFVEVSISPLLHILSPPTMRPVALHLLSENEKSDLSQLVMSMVSYALTYKNTKSVRSTNLRKEDALDVITLSLDPPITEFIHFKGYNSLHFDLSLAVKQVLVHEVEKQKILQSSLSKSSDPHTKENIDPGKNYAGSGLSLNFGHRNESIEKKKIGERKIPTAGKTGNLMFSNSKVAEPGGSIAVAKVKSVERPKKRGGDLMSFFTRSRKVGDEDDPQVTNNAEQRLGKMQRDSHTLLFKFNEGFTNAVKRPVRIREFLL